MALSDPRLNAFSMIQVSFITNEWCYLVISNKVTPAYGTLSLQLSELTRIESGPAKLTEDFRYG